ncbi:MAG: hypothetical protein MJ071_03930 [Oscillospiraceae bacterium]|nr:hypothetical protein [Oscillospiraceae bacterium]
MSNGKKISIAVAVYVVAKQILNGCIGGFSAENTAILIIGAVAALCFYRNVRYSNYVLAAVMAVVALRYLPGNLMHFQLLYLLEGVVDILGAIVLAFHPTVQNEFRGS